MDKYYIITFQNTHQAIKAEEVLKVNKIICSVMPTPTMITRSCGISIIFKENEKERVISLVEHKQLEIKAMYYKENNNYIEIN
ncbi:DUF3343 domain-containing protein [Clostridium sp. JN-9]|uniref:DUF3343 domain-containing protein n=1 Tax=Clostridium sp. JN-9 TaxID=2507159 RepID=UPI000FFE2A52|nr:DUF3343 domain-containing protein [Clostridium sp. JN-9]QAT41546.1 DUF3343 domain-containing protein [Clostridium sp. JN-9]